MLALIIMLIIKINNNDNNYSDIKINVNNILCTMREGIVIN